jgi:hypothetical protein
MIGDGTERPGAECAANWSVDPVKVRVNRAGQVLGVSIDQVTE